MPYQILLVDDDADFREELAESFDDYEFVHASSGEKALEIIKKPNEIDLILLDVMMPGASGTEILAEIKKIEPGIKVVMLTGHSSKDVAVEALKGRADDFLEKPLNINEAKEIIEKLLDSTDTDEKTEIGDIKSKIERVKRFAERNFHKKVSLDDAAAVVGLSPKYLSRAFEENTGMGFSDYKTKVKIDRSKEFLKKGYNINQISDKLGYQNTESFIRAFKKLTNMTPTEFRNSGKTKAGKKKVRKAIKKHAKRHGKK
jgi:YesN/AraC family two-component response regulator